jgi:hypothetical protein
VTVNGVIFGALNSCRVLAKMASKQPNIVWPEQVTCLVAANAQELTLQAMTTGVTLILTAARGAPDTAYSAKLRTSLAGMLEWLDAHVEQARAELPARDISYFEAALFSLIRHLEFRYLVPVSIYMQLQAFAAEWGQRESARLTPFEFD